MMHLSQSIYLQYAFQDKGDFIPDLIVRAQDQGRQKFSVIKTNIFEYKYILIKVMKIRLMQKNPWYQKFK